MFYEAFCIPVLFDSYERFAPSGIIYAMRKHKDTPATASLDNSGVSEVDTMKKKRGRFSYKVIKRAWIRRLGRVPGSFFND